MAAAIAFGLALLAAPAMAQNQPRAGAADPTAPFFKEAGALLDGIRRSTLEPGWRAAAEARMARARARSGDPDAARVHSQNAELALAEPAMSRAPGALQSGPTLAVMAQALADAKDPATAKIFADQSTVALRQMTREPGAQANFFPVVALAWALAGAPDQAAGALLEALRAAAATQNPRERLAALGQIAQGQAQIGDRDAAASTLLALEQTLAQVTERLPRATATAQWARAESAMGQAAQARVRLRQSAELVNLALADPQNNPAPALVSALAIYAVGQREAGDRTSARQALQTITALTQQITAPYERFQALVTYIEAYLQVER
jgi:hypothetical protein